MSIFGFLNDSKGVFNTDMFPFLKEISAQSKSQFLSHVENEEGIYGHKGEHYEYTSNDCSPSCTVIKGCKGYINSYHINLSIIYLISKT